MCMYMSLRALIRRQTSVFPADWFCLASMFLRQAVAVANIGLLLVCRQKQLPTKVGVQSFIFDEQQKLRQTPSESMMRVLCYMGPCQIVCMLIFFVLTEHMSRGYKVALRTCSRDFCPAQPTTAHPKAIPV